MQFQVFLVPLILGIWLLILSIVVWRLFALFNKLTRGVEVTDIKKVLEKVLDREEINKADIAEAVKRIGRLEEEGKVHIQKVGLSRFNPFKELGGDHSFSLAILDANDSGIIITSLHTRDRTRVYMKDVKKGESNFELSADEKKALSIAQRK
ncbi:MAG TPA: DUF4446 family protein [Patescibacteria group bacterium]|nr:DUF4446 family protein [Patescibacteria group bacterium]